jgi:hypothetical protein
VRKAEEGDVATRGAGDVVVDPGGVAEGVGAGGVSGGCCAKKGRRKGAGCKVRRTTGHAHQQLPIGNNSFATKRARAKRQNF